MLNNTRAFAVCLRSNLIASNRQCIQFSSDYSLEPKQLNIDGFVWRCSNRVYRKTLSLRINSWFEGSKLAIKKRSMRPSLDEENDTMSDTSKGSGCLELYKGSQKHLNEGCSYVLYIMIEAIENRKYIHEVVIHHDNFVYPDTGTHTNNIKGGWRWTRNFMRITDGVNGECFHTFISDVREIYDLYWLELYFSRNTLKTQSDFPISRSIDNETHSLNVNLSPMVVINIRVYDNTKLGGVNSMIYQINMSGWRLDKSKRSGKIKRTSHILYDSKWEDISIKFSIIDPFTGFVELSEVLIKQEVVKYSQSSNNIIFKNLIFTAFNKSSEDHRQRSLCRGSRLTRIGYPIADTT
ncbi:hypothetical protein RF11_00982 [Thelohanellus kitauei]|uniref:Uncharacterized protein n=1 Tax=Thelohanellus kitauei TaxID=669202 RepID=A0A0C2JD19_THEKT|nr:hypothetical protein RF11_00982 [Thelohanellus kitauei]